MPFKKRKIWHTAKKTIRRRKIKKRNSVSFAITLRKVILYSILGFIILSWLLSFILYQKYIQSLPSIEELENLEIAESSTIYDRDGNELYSIFKEKRTYINYDDINDHMIHAIVAWEDKRFFQNPWVDIIGLFRAVLYRVIWKNDSLAGTSTLTQQLIRNTIITNERTAERKIKEMYLAYKLTNDVSKEKILELYLNKISFWSNAFGIEQASKTFFGKTAKSLNVLESSILASLPKWPTYYSPYNNYDRVVGHPYIYSSEDAENTINIITKEDAKNNSEALSELQDFISGLKLKRFSDTKALLCWLDRDKLKQYISVDTDGCSVLAYSEMLPFLNGIKIQLDESNTIEYQTGRKDFILGRMLEDGYINFGEYKESLLNSFGYTFNEYKENIKYPHFVFYIREYLEQKYGKEVIEKGGFKIYTSIDPEIQDAAQAAVEKHSSTNSSRFWAENAAVVSIDNETGEILAMVGWKDYFDQENKWNVNIITSRLQPGSTFKPFVYSMAVDRELIGTKTPIYDVKTSFPGWYIPNNFDGKFMGKMTVTKALNYSRNIPAVKMFYLAWWEKAIINFMESLGVTTLWDFKAEYYENYEKEYSYGASMSLWTGLMTPLELAQAYSVYANMWYKKELMPITKIFDGKGNVIEDFSIEENEWEKVLDASTAFITNHMLSETESRPAFWNTYLSLPGRKVAAKTGTSTKQYRQWWRDYIFPRNLWTIGYTPQVTTVVWAGNTDGTELKDAGNWLEGAWPIWKDVMQYIHRDRSAKNWSKPWGVKEVPISRVSWDLVPEGYNENLIVSSLFKNPPQEYDNNLQPIDVDALCNWSVWPNTPTAAIKQVTLLAFHSLKPENANWELPVQEWVKSWEFAEEEKELFNIPNVVAKINPEICKRPDVVSEIQIATTLENNDPLVIGANYIEFAYKSNTPIKAVEVYLWDEKLKDIVIGNRTQGVYRWELFIPKWFSGNYSMTLRAVDAYYFYQDTSVAISINWRDPNPPSIVMTNPSDNSIKLFKWDFFNLKWNVEDTWSIRSINIYIDGQPEKIGLTGRSFNYPIGSLNLDEGIHTIMIEAVDSDLKVWKTEVQLEILPKQ